MKCPQCGFELGEVKESSLHTSTNIEMRYEKRQPDQILWQPRTVYIMTPIVSFFYLYVLYDYNWRTFDELIKQFPVFMSFAFSIGIIMSALPLRKPIEETFLANAPVPTLCFLFELFVRFLIKEVTAHERFLPHEVFAPSLKSFTVILLTTIFTFGVGLAFGAIAALGCHIGLTIKTFFNKVHQIIISRKTLAVTDESQFGAAKIA